MQAPYPYSLPVANPVKLFELSRQAVPQELEGKVPPKIASIALTVLAECTDAIPRSCKKDGWDIVAINEQGVKKLFITERKKPLQSHVEAFSCRRSLVVLFAPDSFQGSGRFLFYKSVRYDT